MNRSLLCAIPAALRRYMGGLAQIMK